MRTHDGSSVSGSGGGYVSLWLDEAMATEPAGQDSALPGSADIVIVGGGFTGLWTALHLKEADSALSVCVVEAEYCGYGASGRNGGIAGGSVAKFPLMKGLFGPTGAVELVDAIERSLDDLVKFCSANAIEADLRQSGSVWVASNQSQLGSWEKAYKGILEHDSGALQALSCEEAQEATGSRAVHGGVYARNGATLQPGKLVRGLRRVAIERGVVVCEGRRMVGLDVGESVVVSTDSGSIRAGKVVLASGAWAARRREIQPFVFVTSSDIVATARIDEARLVGGLGTGLAMDDSRRLILYWRTTPDGRVVFGKGGGWMSVGNRIGSRFTGESRFRPTVEARFRRLYPQFRDVVISHSWSGPIGYSSSGLPYCGPLGSSPRVLVGVGYSGMGVVQTNLAGRILASLALERDDHYAGLPLTRRWGRRLPPEPLRSLGAPIVKVAMSRKEMMEDADVAPGRVVRAFARLDPTGSPNQG